MNRRNSRRSHPAPPPSVGAAQSKLIRIVSCHEQLKVAFHQLTSQIRTGLLEVEDVFESLALQLMKLVGVKTVEMVAERRFSTIITSGDRFNSQEVNYMNKAIQAGNELMGRQKLQLMQLITLLRNIEAQVNSSQTSIFQSLADQQAFMKKFFIRACSYVASIHHSGKSNDLSQVMLSILKATFDHVGAALESVEAGIDELISELADKMCNPMVEYVNGLKFEMKNGTCSCLLEVVREMHEAMQVRALELEETRKQARFAEESRVEALIRLMKSEETAKKLMISLESLTEDNTGLQKNWTKEKPVTMKKQQAKDDSLLWELLQKKMKSLSDCPLEPDELLGVETCSKKLPPKRKSPSDSPIEPNELLVTSSKKLPLIRNIPSPSHRPTTRSQFKRPHPQSSFSNSRLVLHSSLSATKKVPCGKRVTP